MLLFAVGRVCCWLLCVAGVCWVFWDSGAVVAVVWGLCVVVVCRLLFVGRCCLLCAVRYLLFVGNCVDCRCVKWLAVGPVC